MSFNKSVRDEETCFGPFVRQRMLNEQSNSQKHLVPAMVDRYRRPPMPRVMGTDALFEKTVSNIVAVIAKKNPRLDQTKDTILEPITRSKVSEIMK